MRDTGRSLARSIIGAILMAMAALIIGVMQSLTTAVTASLGLTAVQAIIVPGTGTQHPAEVANYLPNVVNHYLVPGGECGAPPDCVRVPADGIEYDAQFWPIPLPGWGGLEGAKWNVSVQSGVDAVNAPDAYPAAVATGEPIVIFGYSQGATVVSLIKAQNEGDSAAGRTTYFFIGNPQRPNGGVFERLAFLGTVPILDATFGNPTPTDTCLREDPCATDVALMYDGVVDSPSWLLNPVALANALAGFAYVHGTYLAPDGDDAPTATPYGYEAGEVEQLIANAKADCSAATYCQRVDGSDTMYITLPARYLPLYQPSIDLGTATGTSALIVPIVDLVSPATQTIIETGYDRTDYSNPTPGGLLPPANFSPIKVATDLVKDVPEGINMALTPGHTPLPPLEGQGPQTTTTLQVSDDPNTVVAKTESPKLTTPDIRLGLIAKPGEGVAAAGANGSNANRPLSNALKDFHPVRDVVKAVSGEVKKALGKDDSSAAGDNAESN